jgi:hypothetical protein
VRVHPYGDLDYRRWTAWWGDRNEDHGNGNRDRGHHNKPVYPEFPNDWNTEGTVVMSLRHAPPLWMKAGATVDAGYQLAVGGREHPAATVSLVSGSVQADVQCFDGRSFTLTIPFPETESLSIPAGDQSFYPRNTLQGSATSTTCSGVLQGAYFTALGISTGAGNAGGPGFTTTTPESPLVTRFRVSADARSTPPSQPLVVNFDE